MRTLSTCIAISAAVPFFLGGSVCCCRLLAQSSATSRSTELTGPVNLPVLPLTLASPPVRPLLLARSEPIAAVAAEPANIAPGASLSPQVEPSLSSSASFAFGFISASALPCRSASVQDRGPDVDSADQSREPCLQSPTPDTRHLFLNSTVPVALTPFQKLHLAEHSLFDPGNLATILGNAAFTVATNPYTAYGPGWNGFARDAGVSFTQDMTGVFFSTFLIPSLTHEDPHYHRMPHAGIPRRIVHAISRTVMAQSDTGKLMPNFATLLGYPINAEFSNLYVPGIHSNGPSTVARIATGYATDPINNLITEFLPDVARHIQVRVLFAQRILNQVATDQYALP